jgi:putative SOS response-associated peptidase YedK
MPLSTLRVVALGVTHPPRSTQLWTIEHPRRRPQAPWRVWQNTPSGKQPWYFTARDGSPAAGLWDEWKNRETGERLKSCAMIVVEPNEIAAEIHDRMPVFLAQEQFEPWLSGETEAEYLKPAPNDYLQRWPVAKRVKTRMMLL